VPLKLFAFEPEGEMAFLKALMRAASRGCNSVSAMKIQRRVEKSNDMTCASDGRKKTCASDGRKKSLSRTSANSADRLANDVRIRVKADIGPQTSATTALPQ